MRLMIGIYKYTYNRYTYMWYEGRHRGNRAQQKLLLFLKRLIIFSAINFETLIHIYGAFNPESSAVSAPYRHTNLLAKVAGDDTGNLSKKTKYCLPFREVDIFCKSEAIFDTKLCSNCIVSVSSMILFLVLLQVSHNENCFDTRKHQ